jgi:hypothetical protein
VIIGIVLQTAIFHIYGKLSGGLTERASALACATIAAVTALAERTAALPLIPVVDERLGGPDGGDEYGSETRWFEFGSHPHAYA